MDRSYRAISKCEANDCRDKFDSWRVLANAGFSVSNATVGARFHSAAAMRGTAQRLICRVPHKVFHVYEKVQKNLVSRCAVRVGFVELREISRFLRSAGEWNALEIVRPHQQPSIS